MAKRPHVNEADEESLKIPGAAPEPRGALSADEHHALLAADRAGLRRGDLRGDMGNASQEETYLRDKRRPAVEERRVEDREFSEDRAYSDQERLDMLRSGYFQEALPNIPPRAGWHRCWLTTTNSRATVGMAMRLGYRLLKAEDMGPGWDQSKETSAQYPGAVMINEMIAAEIDEDFYQLMMRELHHKMPQEAENGIYGRMQQIESELIAKGSRLIDEDDTFKKILTDRRPAPTF